MRQAFWDKTRRVDKEAKSLWATSLVTSASEFKAGGTGLVTFGRLAPRIKESRTDRLGRWCYQVMEERGREVLLVNVYQVCKKLMSVDGKLTTAQQQRIMLSKENRDNRDPQKQFQKDLAKLLVFLGVSLRKLVNV